ncbi:MAG: DNA primase [Calditrichaceae bacterium]|nr:DNA primase [Calditrichia bacterium]NUQ43890.1 DNA primase [Calditrichaceae bacterium]
MAGIPESIIDRIRESVNIVDVIGRYVTLKKRGRNYLGLCPFHTEKTPSFNVNPEKQIFHCFGCGTGGNVFTFLMRYENLSFVDAVKRLADETGIKIPVSQEAKKQESENEQLFRANEVAESVYHQQLKQAPAAVQEYLQRRGISAETREQFKLGYASGEWDGLLKYLERNGFSLNPYKKLGLLLESEKSGKLFDRFRNRLMFPIHNQSGKVIGFGGRALLDEPNSPKYMNSPESPVYQKSRILYGLYFSKEAIRESGAVIFVEGYMDFLQLYQAGIRNVVATSGTALTEEHARLIRRYTNRVYLCYDADTAGINAAVRGGEILFQQLLEVEALILPAGEDPDSFVKANGKEAFLALLKEAKDYLAFRLSILNRKYDLQKAAERSRAVAEALEMLLPMQDAIRSGFYLEKIAEQLQVPATTLLNEFQRRQKARRQQNQFREQGREGGDSPGAAPAAAESAAKAPLVFTGAWGGEKDVILLLISYFKDIHDYVFNHLQEDDFLNPEFRELFALIKSRRESGESSGAPNLLHFVLENIPGEAVKTLLLRELEQSNREFHKPALYLQDCIKRIKIARYQAKIDLAKRQMKELAPNDPRQLQFLMEINDANIQVKKWQDVVSSDDG